MGRPARPRRRTVPGLAPAGVCVKNVGANAFSLVVTLFWLYTLQPDRNMLVSGARAIHVAPEQHVWPPRHNQTGII